MKKTVNLNDFRQEFEDMGRGDQFGSAALGALFDYLERLEEDCGQEMELDVIAICCEWTEYDSEDLIADYGYLLDRDDMDEEEYLEALLATLQENTTVIKVEENTWVIQDF